GVLLGRQEEIALELARGQELAGRYRMLLGHVLAVGRGLCLPERAGGIAGREQRPRDHRLLLDADDAGPVVARLPCQGRFDASEGGDLHARLRRVVAAGGSNPTRKMPESLSDAALT